ncbi:MAG: lysine--tRNA ligase [Acidimicrobiales bacterium]|nr:MAG: lysine--tRNA ligase [Acidimicrobiales bacterium]
MNDHLQSAPAVEKPISAPTEAASDTAGLDDIPEQMRVRRAKRSRLLAEGGQPYPVNVPRNASLRQVRERFADLATDATSGHIVSISGRVMFLRTGGKLCFATVQEGDGTTLQLMLSLAKVGTEALAEWKSQIDIGDFVSVTGEVISSKRGELSVLADKWMMAAKALRPLPITHKPMAEESRVRRRYLDLILRPAARDIVRTRSATLRSMRSFFDTRDFMEVETPMLQVQHGGAAARPFVTHINAYDIDLYLRIAPELYLKRCMVGGMERVFEVNRNFRNEGADSSHSPEFAMLECYEAYGDYNSMATLTRELVQYVARQVCGSEVARHVDGSEHDLSGIWRSIELYDAISHALGEHVSVATPQKTLLDYAGKHQIDVNPGWGPGKIAEEIFEKLVVPGLLEPTFVRDYPVETAPLTRDHRQQPGLTEKWDLYVRGFELATAYSELVDPVIQRERLLAQARLSAQGDDEAMQLDEEFLQAMEYAMPPCGGMGMGIDRLLMLLTGLGIRETILFPLVRPE